MREAGKVPEARLRRGEREALQEACSSISSAARNDFAHLISVFHAAATRSEGPLCALAALIADRVRGRESRGCLHLRNLPRAKHPQVLSILLACLLGEPISEHPSKPLCKEVKSDGREAFGRPSARDSREFFLHTDLSYSSSPPPFFLLHSLVNERADGGFSTLCELRALRGKLSAAALRELAIPQFYFPLPDYYPGEGSVLAAILVEHTTGERFIRFRRDGLRSRSRSGMVAAIELVQAIAALSHEIHLPADSVLFIDNRRWLHGRTAFLPPLDRRLMRHLHQVYAE